MKTIKLSLNIADNDFDRKMSQAEKFLAKKHQVKVIVQLRGRERGRPEMGVELLERVDTRLSLSGSRANQFSARNLSVTYNPKK